jgi:putative component of toxin-antitoxin plasmid stabilization module
MIINKTDTFIKWFDKLKDKIAKAIIIKRLKK